MNSREGKKCSLDELADAMVRLPEIDQAVVLEQLDSSGKNKPVAYLAIRDPLTPPELGVLLRETPDTPPIEFECVMLGSLPLAADGAIDFDALEKLPVIDEQLVTRCQQAVTALPGVTAAEAVPILGTRGVGKIHRMDLLRGINLDCAPSPAENSSQPESGAAGSDLSIVHGDRLDLSGLPPTLGGLLRRTAQQFGDKGIHYINVDGSEQFQSYDDLLREASRLSAGMQGEGLAPGDRVIFQFASNHEFVTAFWACVLSGLVPVPISVAPVYQETNAVVQKLINVWRMLEAPLILSSAELMDSVAQVFTGQDAGRLRIRSLQQLQGDSGVFEQPQISPDDLTLLLLTSGSTGTPKAVMHSHRTLLARSAATSAFNDFSSGEVSMNWMPLDHVGGIVMFHLRDVFNGTTQLQVASNWVLEAPLRWLDIIDKYRVAVTWAPNFAYSLVADCAEDLARGHWDLSCVRFVLNGGEQVVPKTARRFLRLLGPHGLAGDVMHPAWGMSETASGITYSHDFSLDSTSDEDTLAEVGAPIHNTSLRIVDDENRILGEGQKGRLQAQGASIMLGYLQNPEANASAFTDDGWFDTGDLGVLRNGRLTLLARTKDEIIINGINYLASEIESVVDGEPGVLATCSAACAVRGQGAETDQMAVFFVAEDDSRQTLARLLPRIAACVAERIGIKPKFLVPLREEEVPKTNIGKIQRSLLKQNFEAGYYDETVKQADLLRGSNLIPDWFMRKAWYQRQPVLSARRDSGGLLIFADHSGVADRVRERIDEPVTQVVFAAGKEFESDGAGQFVIDPGNPVHYSMLLSELESSGFELGRIAHLCCLDDAGPAEPEAAGLDAAQSSGLYSLLYLLQALDSSSLAAYGIELTVFGSGNLICDDSDAGACLHSTIPGMLKSANHELDWLQASFVDLEDAVPESSADQVLTELAGAPGDEEVAYRNGQRLVAGLAPADLVAALPNDETIRHGGVYLITGGLGGVGAALAKYLARHFAARLILVGTTELPPRKRWDRLPEDDDRLAARIRNMLEIEALGTDCFYQAVDAADENRLEQVVVDAEEKWGEPLAGIFHLAVGGDMRAHWQDSDRYNLLNESVESFAQMFNSKVHGTIALYRIAERRPDSLLVTFGSVLGTVDGARYGSYPAAHTFLHNYILRQQGRRNQVDVRHFAWAVWERLGLSDSDPVYARDYYHSIGYHLIAEREGMDCLMAALARNQQDLIIGLDADNWNIRRRLLGEPTPLYELAAVYLGDVEPQPGPFEFADGFGAPVSCRLVAGETLPGAEPWKLDLAQLEAKSSQKAAESVSAAPASELERSIAFIWKDLLDGSEPRVNDSFFALGGTSLRATQVLSRLRQSFNIDLHIRELFENATIRELAELIEKRRSQARDLPQTPVNQIDDPASVVADIDNLSDEQVAELLDKLQVGRD